MTNVDKNKISRHSEKKVKTKLGVFWLKMNFSQAFDVLIREWDHNVTVACHKSFERLLVRRELNQSTGNCCSSSSSTWGCAGWAYEGKKIVMDNSMDKDIDNRWSWKDLPVPDAEPDADPVPCEKIIFCFNYLSKWLIITRTRSWWTCCCCSSC